MSAPVRIVRALLAPLALLAAAAPARAQEHREHDHHAAHEPEHRHLAHADAHGGYPAFVDIFFTHHAYLEKKLHPRLDGTFGDDGREYAGSGELVWQFGDRFGFELEAGFATSDPAEGSAASGMGDLEIAPMVVLHHDAERLLIVTVRSGIVLPTGDEDEGFGNEGWGWEPSLLAWKGFGREKRSALQAELGYERVFADATEDEEELVYNLGWSYWLPSNWIPIVEINGVTPLGEAEGEHHEDGEIGRGLAPAHGEAAESEDTLVATTLGFRYAFANGQQWGAGVQLPLNGRQAYDLRLVVGGIIHLQ